MDLAAAATLGQPLLYWADARDEVVFLDTTRPLLLRPLGSGPEDSESRGGSGGSGSSGGGRSGGSGDSSVTGSGGGGGDSSVDGELPTAAAAAAAAVHWLSGSVNERIPVMDAFLGRDRRGAPLEARAQVFGHLAHAAVASLAQSLSLSRGGSGLRATERSGDNPMMAAAAGRRGSGVNGSPPSAALGGEHGRVVVLWNECGAQFEPHDEQWALYGLGGGSETLEVEAQRRARKFFF